MLGPRTQRSRGPRTRGSWRPRTQRSRRCRVEALVSDPFFSNPRRGLGGLGLRPSQALTFLGFDLGLWPLGLMKVD